MRVSQSLDAGPVIVRSGSGIEEENTGLPRIMEIRRLDQEHRRAGKLASSLVIHIRERIDIDRGPRAGTKMLDTTKYDCRDQTSTVGSYWSEGDVIPLRDVEGIEICVVSFPLSFCCLRCIEIFPVGAADCLGKDLASGSLPAL